MVKEAESLTDGRMASGMYPSSSATRPTTFRTEKLLSENADKITDGNETVAESHANSRTCPARGQPSQFR